MANAPTLTIYAYPPSDTWEHLTSKVTRPDGTQVNVIWSDYERVSLAVYATAADNSLGALVCSVNSVDDPTLFRAPAASQVLQINTSKLPGIAPFPVKPYQCLLKVHDTNQPDGQVIADPKTDNDKVTLLLNVFPGGE